MQSTEEFSTITSPVPRRQILKAIGAGALVAAVGAALAGCGGGSSSSSTTSSDQTILNAAATAEGLAATMYANLIASPLYTSGLSGNVNDQAYIVAAFEQEVEHYNYLLSAGATPAATIFYFPVGMFGSGSVNYQTTINTLVTLEDAFIAAYLTAVAEFSTVTNKVIAAQILGVESEHRVLARVITADLGLTATDGYSGVQENVNGPSYAANNLAYERQFPASSNPLNTIPNVVKALTPFITAPASSGGFGAQSYPLVTSLPVGVSQVNLADTTPAS